MPRSKETILDEVLKAKGRRGRMGREMQANKEANWLLAVFLNTFAKVDAGGPLSSLEQTIVDAFKEEDFPEAELKEHGRLFQKMSQADKKRLFPGKFAQLTPQKKYEAAEFKEDLPNIQKQLLAEPNAVDIDVEGVHAGDRSLKEFTVGREARQQYGRTILRVVAENTTPPNPTYTIKATGFRCNDETGADWWGSDEPYWIFGSLGAGVAVTRKSQTFNDVDTGESRQFSASDGCIWGQMCQPADFPNGEIGSLISLWEHDAGNEETVRKGVAAAFTAAAGILAATGVAAWIGAVVAGVGAVIGWLVGFMDEDHLADQTVVYTRQTVVDRLAKAGAGASFNESFRFIGGGGDYTLTLQVRRAS